MFHGYKIQFNALSLLKFVHKHLLVAWKFMLLMHILSHYLGETSKLSFSIYKLQALLITAMHWEKTEQH